MREEYDDFGVSGRSLFRARHWPDGQARGVVVFCHAFGEEKKNPHRVFVELARELAGRGIASVRFDFTGCGDSAGSLRDATMERWLEDLGAVFNAAAEFGDVPRFLLGLRLGASVAARFAAGREDIAGLALWHPIVNGKKTFAAELRRTLIKEMLTAGAGKSSRDELLRALESGAGEVDLDGFPLTGALYQGIAGVDLLADERPYSGPVLLAQLSHSESLMPEMKALAERLGGLGAFVQTAPVVSPPIWARIERVETDELATATLDWVESVVGQASGQNVAQASSLAGPKHAAGTAAPQEGQASGTNTGGHVQAWKPVVFDSGGTRLVGILGEPPSGAASGIGVVLAHGWSGYRIGPHRILTRTARRLNEAGYVTLHFDLRGRGDSGGEYASTDLDMMIADANRAAEFLREEAGCAQVCLLGICSGANVCLGAATLDKAVKAVAAWSALPFQKQAGAKQAAARRKGNLAAYARKLLRPSTWLKIVRGRVHYGMVGKALKGSDAAESGGRNLKDSERDILAELADYPGKLFFVHGDKDAEGMAGREHFQEFCKENNLQAGFYLVEGANHSFYSLKWEDDIVERTIRFFGEGGT